MVSCGALLAHLEKNILELFRVLKFLHAIQYSAIHDGKGEQSRFVSSLVTARATTSTQK
jgi:hypothetical protein